MGQNSIFWVLGILAIIVGFVIFLSGIRTSQKKSPSGGIVEKDGLPILPRHKRSIPKLDDENASTDDTLHINIDQGLQSKIDIAPVATPSIKDDEPKLSINQIQSIPIELDDTVIFDDSDTNQTVVQADDVPEFQGEASTMSHYFEEQEAEYARNDDALLNQKHTVTIMLTPKNSFEGIDGDAIIQFAKRYALKHGTLNMFHRYEDPKGVGMLWFSMLGATTEGLEAFDLPELHTMNYRGLAFFVALPHPQALRGFDSMVQVAMSIAQELDADLHDEDGYLLDKGQLQSLRAKVSEYNG